MGHVSLLQAVGLVLWRGVMVEVLKQQRLEKGVMTSDSLLTHALRTWTWVVRWTCCFMRVALRQGSVGTATGDRRSGGGSRGQCVYTSCICCDLMTLRSSGRPWARYRNREMWSQFWADAAPICTANAIVGLAILMWILLLLWSYS